MKINIITSVPEYFIYFYLNAITRRLMLKSKIILEIIDIKQFAKNKHAEDKIYGGIGLALRADLFYNALEQLDEKGIIIMPSAHGLPITQGIVDQLSISKVITFLCGRFEGIDERINETADILELRFEKAIFNSSEILVVAALDAILRKITLSSRDKAVKLEESFAGNRNILDSPAYTRPKEFNKISVPEILLSGDFKKIHEFRQQEALIRSLIRLEDCQLDNEQIKIALKILVKIIKVLNDSRTV